MADHPNVKEFPDISSKLGAPTKKSQFEKAKAESEAKKAREAEETAAVYKDFVKSFEDDPPYGASASSSGGKERDEGFGMRGAFGGRRNFPPGAQSGPSRMSGPGSLGPPPSLSKKRTLEGAPPPRRGRQTGVFSHSDDEDEMRDSRPDLERSPPKPTLQFSSMPPATSHALVKSLIPSSITVESIRFVTPTNVSASDRKTAAAIVTAVQDTPAAAIEAALATLQRRYMGCGYYLSISRGSTHALGGSNASLPPLQPTGPSSLPFGAKPVSDPSTGPMDRAPPQSYNPRFNQGRGNEPPPSQPQVRVQVQTPTDIGLLRLIHMTVEAVLESGPEFEALLMSRSEIQKNEKYAWLWDSSSQAGVYYRWKLWTQFQMLSCADCDNDDVGMEYNKATAGEQQPFIDAAPWVMDKKDLKFEYVNGIEDFFADPAYESDASDSEDEEQQPPADAEKPPYLNPYERSKFAFLLSTLPTSTAKLRVSDVADVTYGAIKYSVSSVEEIAAMVVSNLVKPFSTSGATDQDDPDDGAEKKHDDPAGPRLIGLFVLHDILQASASTSVRHAWKYRQAFEIELKKSQTFERLGRLAKDFDMGRFRADRWSASVRNVLNTWVSSCVFSKDSLEQFIHAFENPPLTEAEKEAEEAAKKARVASAQKQRQQPGTEGFAENEDKEGDDGTTMEDVIDGQPMDDDLDGKPMDEDLDGKPMDEDLDGKPMDEDDDIDGQPMDESDLDGEAGEEDEPQLGKVSNWKPLEEEQYKQASDDQANRQHQKQSSYTTPEPSDSNFTGSMDCQDGTEAPVPQHGRKRARPTAKDFL